MNLREFLRDRGIRMDAAAIMAGVDKATICRVANGKTQAPHIVFCIYSRGMLRQIYTRLYFSDEPTNDGDPILTLVPPDRRGTLIAHKQMRGEVPVYRFDIRVQGENETVFFDI